MSEQVCDLSRVAGQRIRAARKQRGWSQRDLSRESGVGQAMICLVEGGERNLTLTALERIAAAFGMGPGVLLADDTGCPHKAALRAIAEIARSVP